MPWLNRERVENPDERWMTSRWTNVPVRAFLHIVIAGEPARGRVKQVKLHSKCLSCCCSNMNGDFHHHRSSRRTRQDNLHGTCNMYKTIIAILTFTVAISGRTFLTTWGPLQSSIGCSIITINYPHTSVQRVPAVAIIFGHRTLHLEVLVQTGLTWLVFVSD